MHYRSLVSVTDKKHRSYWLSPVTCRVIGAHLQGLAKSMASLMLMFGLQVVLFATPAQGAEELTHQFKIPRQRADTALTALGQQGDTTVIFQYELVRDQITNQLQGEYSLSTAVAILLANTALSAKLDPAGHLIIIDAKFGNNQNRKGKREMNIKAKRSLLATVVSVFSAGGIGFAAAQDEPVMTKSVLDEIIVTASKRGAGTSIQDTAMAISAVGTDAIEKRGLVGMDDYLRSIPGVSFQDRGASQNSIVIRGVVSNPQTEEQSTVGVYFGETPVTGLGSTGNGNAAGNVDLKLVDIERIEVLRGPQGTLYGSGSMGGTVRVIPQSPNLGQMEGKLAMRYGQVGGQGSESTMVQGVLNIPLIDNEWAVRLVAYQFDNSGYINNVAASNTPAALTGAVALGGQARDLHEVGGDKYDGFRATTLWEPNSSLSVALGYVKQKIEQRGLSEVNLDLPGKFEQARLGVGQGGQDNEGLTNDIEIITADVKWDLRWGQLTSASSWLDYSASSDWDGSFALGLPATSSNSGGTDRIVQELRFESQLDGRLQFLAGLYYEKNQKDASSPILWSGDPVLEASVVGSIPFAGGPWTSLRHEIDQYQDVEQIAAFTEFSYNVSDQLSVSIGSRYFDYDQQYGSVQNGPFTGGEIRTSADNKDNGTTYKANVSFTPNDHNLIYAQWAEGFRLGEPQTPVGTCDPDQDGRIAFSGTELEVSDVVSPDDLESYELGFKTSFADKRVTMNAAIFRINWDRIPVTQTADCGASFEFNAGQSKAEGVELEVAAQVTEELQLHVTASYGESTLAEDAVNLGRKGDNLPGSADFNFSTALEYHFSFANMESFARIDYLYVDEYYHNIAEVGQASGGYEQINIKVGTSFQSIDLDLYVKNVTNADDFTWVETGFSALANRAYRLRPRTVGLNLAYRF